MYKHLAVARWAGAAADGSDDQILLTIADPAIPNGSGTTAATAGLANLQLVSDAASDVWGSNPQVLAIQRNGSATPLQCKPAGSRLLCPKSQFVLRSSDTIFEVTDFGHADAAIRAFGTLPRCQDEDCKRPLVWDWTAPKWNQKDGWEFHVSFLNVTHGDDITLSEMIHTAITCASTPCSARITIPRNMFSSITNSTDLTISRSNSQLAKFKFLNLAANISPLLTSIDDPQTQTFRQKSGLWKAESWRQWPAAHTGLCHTADSCHVTENYGKGQGFLYFVDPGSTPIPVSLASEKGTSRVYHNAPSDKSAVAPAGSEKPLKLPKTDLFEFKRVPMYALEQKKEDQS